MELDPGGIVKAYPGAVDAKVEDNFVFTVAIHVTSGEGHGGD